MFRPTLPHDAIVWKKIKAAAIAVAFYLIPFS